MWQWEAKPSDSPLIKRVLQLHDRVLHQAGGQDSTNMKITDWYAGEKQGAGRAYKFFRPKAAVQSWGRVMWKPYILPKHRFTFWLLGHGKLMTKDRMSYEPCKTCALCQQADETCNHLFFQCPVNKNLWTKVKRWLGIWQEQTTAGRLFRVIRTAYRGNGCLVRARILAITYMIYLLWQARNRCQ